MRRVIWLEIDRLHTHSKRSEQNISWQFINIILINYNMLYVTLFTVSSLWRDALLAWVPRSILVDNNVEERAACWHSAVAGNALPTPRCAIICFALVELEAAPHLPYAYIGPMRRAILLENDHLHLHSTLL
jgi:hypothetical protein